jgi:hypothetical protein
MKSWTSRCCGLIFVLASIVPYFLLGENGPNEKLASQTETQTKQIKRENDVTKPENDGPVILNLIPQNLEQLIGRARKLKIYVSHSIKNGTKYREKYPGNKFDPSDKTFMLNPFAKWFWVHDEYSVNSYIVHRAHHDKLTFTENKSQADLCYPSCDDIHVFEPPHWQVRLKLQVAARSSEIFSGCQDIIVGIESQATNCTFAVPYWHSICAPSRHAVSPWTLKTRRQNLLCFIGGSWRGKDRRHIIFEMRALSTAAADKRPALFSAPFLFESGSQEGGVWGTPAFFTQVWTLYATSIFSWQPSGDTGTRRGFYDSWMLGCIPVVSRASADTYRSLFRGRAFSAAGVALEDIAVVLDDETMRSGAAILGNLSAISADEIRRRRSWLGRLAPVMQWGYDLANDRADALLMTLASALSP